MRADLDEKLKQAAEAFGRALAETPAARAYRQAVQDGHADDEAKRLRSELETTYDSLIQRQAAGEIVSRGEVEAYYEMEQRVRANPLLAQHDANLEQVKDTFSDMHTLLSGQLGLNFKDLVD
jgi:cell fate (sporulation/competence/biofilm development) regulator YlbF (YheA/YmcA/DUF963 family)